jgi:hypothetical protein
MNAHTYWLSIEEVAYALGLLGGPETAATYLQNLLGERPADEINGRLLAASHALVARGLLTFDMETTAKELDADFGRVIEDLARAQCVLSLTQRTAQARTAADLYFHGEKVIEHRIDRAVVAELEPLPGRAHATARILDFFGVESGADDAHNAAVATFSAALLSQVKRSDAHVLAALLQAEGVGPSLATQFANDVAATISRGSILQTRPLVMEGAPRIEVQAGVLLMRSTARSWLVHMAQPNPALAQLYPLSAETLRFAVEELTREPVPAAA